MHGRWHLDGASRYFFDSCLVSLCGCAVGLPIVCHCGTFSVRTWGLVWASRLFTVCQVSLFRCWVRWLLGTAFVGKEIVMLNMDETPLQHDYATVRGNVAQSARTHMETVGSFFQRTRRADARGHTTLCGLICNSPHLQQYLPQILLPNSKKRPLSRAERAAYQLLPAPIETWVGTSGWVTARIMCGLIARYRQVIRALRPGALIVLVLDSAAQHVAREVLQHAARLQVYIILVPGQLTWLLQPLDTRVYSSLKRLLAEEHRKIRAASEDGILPANSWIPALGNAVMELLVGKTWSHTFDAMGLCLSRDSLAKSIVKYYPDHVPEGMRPLTGAEVDTMIGRHRVNLTGLFFTGPARLAPLALAPPSSAPRARLLFGFAGRVAASRRRFAALSSPGVVDSVAHSALAEPPSDADAPVASASSALVLVAVPEAGIFMNTRSRSSV